MTDPQVHSGEKPHADTLVRGVCWVMFAFDVGLAIDLDAAQKRLSIAAGGADETQRETIRHPRQAPTYFVLRPPPLRTTRKTESLSIGLHQTTPALEFVLYDFGAVAVTFCVPIDGDLTTLAALSEGLYENRTLLDGARRHVESLVADLKECITRPRVLLIVEDYVVYRLGVDGGVGEDGRAFVARHAQRLARVLRAETGPLSEQEVNDALGCLISYRPSDVCLIDWNAAILFLEDAEDVRTVLEFTNVELLELRQLDDQLDRALDASALAAASHGGLAKLAPRVEKAELRRLAELQTEGSLLFENVNNAFKLVGEQYLARVYRLAGERLHLPDWDATIIRKLETLDSLYQKLTDRGSTRRLELLEWIVIILIAVEVVLSLIPSLRR